MARDLTPFFSPASVAVIGASERASSSGGAVMQMIEQGRFEGRVIPVNPRGGTCFGHPAAKSIAEVSAPADLAVIVVRPDLINQIVVDAASSGHRNLLILPGGFAESGPEGQARDAELRRIAQQHNVTIAGPNCAGLVSMTQGKGAFAPTFLRALPAGPRGKQGIAFISQSGALAEEVVQKSNQENLPVSQIVSVGNAMHLSAEDYLEYLGANDAVSVVTLYVESVADPERLRAVALRTAATKPVVALFGGATAPGARAAQAHTGAKPMTDAAIDQFCTSSGIVRAHSIRELLLAIKGFGFYPRGLAGKRMLVLSNSGGPGVVTTDMTAACGLDLPPLPNRMAEELSQALPQEASVANPLDLLADAREDRFGPCLEKTIEHGSDSFDAVLGIHVVPFMVDAAPVVDRLAALAHTAEAANMPFFHSMMGTLEHRKNWFGQLEAAGIPIFNDSQAMAETAAILTRYPPARATAQAAQQR